MPRDFHTKQPRGIAFVQYEAPEEAAAAIAGFDKHKLGDREVNVQYAEHGAFCSLTQVFGFLPSFFC